MNKRRNIFWLAFLIGSFTKWLPFILWLVCVVPVGVCLYIGYDFYVVEYENGGRKQWN